jgi:hypothetical protein
MINIGIDVEFFNLKFSNSKFSKSKSTNESKLLSYSNDDGVSCA